MPKELPWFKFNTGQYLTGEITTCSMETQGVFANICCYYWNKEGQYKLVVAQKRFPNYLEEIQELIELDIMKVEDGMIVINYLEEQLRERHERSKKLSTWGRKGGKAKAKPKTSQSEAPASKPPTDAQISKEKSFHLFWDLYDKKVGDKTALMKKFTGLSLENINKILLHVPKYVIAEPRKKYRKNPSTYLNQSSWNDEIIVEEINTSAPIRKLKF